MSDASHEPYDPSIERQLHVLVCKILGLDDEDHADDESAEPLEGAIMQLIESDRRAQRQALIAETKTAIVKELQKIQFHMVTHEYDIPTDKRLDEYLTERIAALHQLTDASDKGKAK